MFNITQLQIFSPGQDLRSEYAKFAKVFPGAKLAGVKVPSKWYRRGVGVIEILCGESGQTITS